MGEQLFIAFLRIKAFQRLELSDQSWGLDHGSDKGDEPDVLMIALHGGNSNEATKFRWVGIVRVDQFGDDGSLNNCGTFQGHMEFGDFDAEFIHLSSCNSMDKGDWYPDWASSFKKVHQIDGFHGIMWISTGYNDEYKDFADDGFDMGIAFSWVENLYKYRKSNESMCPVAMAVGVGNNGQSSCWNRLNNEQYNSVFSDPTNPTYYGVIYIQGCNPKGGSTLPSSNAFEARTLGERDQVNANRVAGVPTTAEDELPLLDRTVMTLRLHRPGRHLSASLYDDASGSTLGDRLAHRSGDCTDRRCGR